MATALAFKLNALHRFDCDPSSSQMGFIHYGRPRLVGSISLHWTKSSEILRANVMILCGSQWVECALAQNRSLVFNKKKITHIKSNNCIRIGFFLLIKRNMQLQRKTTFYESSNLNKKKELKYRSCFWS